MSFDWADYHNLANELQNATDGSQLDEAKLRCALSRAYYAAFCSARTLLMSLDRGISDEIGHTELRKEFKRRGNKGNIVATKLFRMSDLRNHADYRDLYPNDLIKETQLVIEESYKVIEMVTHWGKLAPTPAYPPLPNK